VIREKLRNLEEYIHGNDDTDPLIKLAVIHYQFEAIHPFSDGNGRTGRIINSLFLVQKELLDLPVLYLSKYIIVNKGEYYTLLRAVTSKGGWEKWILYMLDGIESTAAETRDKIISIRNLIDQTLETGKKKLPSKVYSKELIELLFTSPIQRHRRLSTPGSQSGRRLRCTLGNWKKPAYFEVRNRGKKFCSSM